MIAWGELESTAPLIADAGRRLLRLNEVAFLATVSSTGRPRLHPFVPRVVDRRLIAFIMNDSPKIKDLRERHQFSIHTLPGAEDEEFYVSGYAIEIATDPDLRARAADAMGFATGVDSNHVLFEFLFDRALHTEWLDFGTASHRPSRNIWLLKGDPSMRTHNDA